ncbi:HEPN domain-containing protein [Azospirillaceae bacterium]
MSRERFTPRTQSDVAPVPFSSAEDAWFWFVQAWEARANGARFSANLASQPRPCEPADILQVVHRLYRQRKLIQDHLCVLLHYGRRLKAPNPHHRREQRATELWREAFAALTPVLQTKGIIP